MSGWSRRSSPQSLKSARDVLGRPLSVGDVVIYSVGRAPLKSGMVLRFDGRGGVFVRILRNSRDDRPISPGTVHIESLSRIVAAPHALKAAVARTLRLHVSRRPRPSELRRRVRHLASNFTQWPRAIGGTTTPEMTLIEVGISDERQAEYQRKMSMLLAGRRSDCEIRGGHLAEEDFARAQQGIDRLNR